jgi:superfamily II DNA or RNA helicase
MYTLFPDQVLVKDELREKFRTGFKRPLLVAPCGFGKGTVAGDMILDAVSKGNRVIFLVNRRELVKDMSKRLKKLGIFHGILMGAQSHGSHMPVLIASVDTLRNRLKDIQAPNLVFVDEAHMFVTEKSMSVLDTLEENGAYIILMTATPWLLSGKGMREIADCIVEGPQVAKLIEQGRLAIPEIYAPEQPDLSSVHVTKSGEYDESETAQVMQSRKLIGDMVKHWKELAPGRKTVGFAVNIATAKEYAEAFNAAGIVSVAVDASTTDKVRDETWRQLASGEVKVVWSVGIISYGWDVPEVDCLILARPTMSLSLCLQQIGRGLRSSPGKTTCIILDHAGNTIKLYPGGSNGLPDTERKWTLEPRRKKGGFMEEEAEIDAMPLVCPKCPGPPVAAARVLKPGTKNCPVCSYEFVKPRSRSAQSELEHDETGQLVKVESRVYIYPAATGDTQKDAALNIAKERGYDPRWLDYRSKAINEVREEYRQRFQTEPKDHWTAGMIRSMLKQADKQGTLALEQVEDKGLEQWLAGKD